MHNLLTFIQRYPRLKKALAFPVVGGLLVLALSGCVVIESQSTSQPSSNTIAISTTICASGTSACTELGASGSTGNSSTDNSPIGALQKYLLLAYRIPTGTGVPSTITATSPTGLIFSQSSQYTAALNADSPISTSGPTSGDMWVGYYSQSPFSDPSTNTSATVDPTFMLPSGLSSTFPYRVVVGYAYYSCIAFLGATCPLQPLLNFNSASGTSGNSGTAGASGASGTLGTPATLPFSCGPSLTNSYAIPSSDWDVLCVDSPSAGAGGFSTDIDAPITTSTSTTTASPTVTTTSPTPTTVPSPPTPTTSAPLAANAPPPPGIPSSALGSPTSVNTSANSTATAVSTMSGGNSASVLVPANALPAGTVVSVYPVTNAATLATQLPINNAYVLSFAVTWLAPNGTSPNSTQPITMTITDPNIHAGDTIYEETANGLVAVGTADQNGSVAITFNNDPTFIVGSRPHVALSSSLGKLHEKQVELKLSCLTGSACTGTAKVSVAREKTSGKMETWTHITLASATVSLSGGSTETVYLSVTKQGAPILARGQLYKRFRMSLLTQMTGGIRSVTPSYIP